MKVSLNWLQDHVDLSGITTEKLDHLLTFAGVEVEDIVASGENLNTVVVAEVLESNPHPNADRLSVCLVDDGSGEPKQIVCGAKNYVVGDKVPLALPGAILGKDFKIKKGKLRGEVSEGMMCSPSELGVPGDDSGLLILPRENAPGTPLLELYPADTIFDLEITPNRPDLLSHCGIAREITALTGRPLHSPRSALRTTGKIDEDPGLSTAAAAGSLVVINPDAATHCPFYSGRRIKGVKVAPSPAWLRDKLTSIGLRPINNIVDITNYVLMETGQPLHAFDAAEISGNITVRLAAEGETFTALDENEYPLSPDDVLIADDAKAVAIGGVMGGQNSGVTGKTTGVILESAWFTPSCIRRTSRHLGLGSDSSYRFERGVDAEGVLRASALATKLILEIAGGEAAATTFTAGAIPVHARSIAFDENHARHFLGADIDSAEMHRIFTALGLSLESEKEGVSNWNIPSFRLDLQRHIDLVEEIARVVGLDRIPATLSSVPSEESPEDRAHDLDARVCGQLVDTGFFEIKTIKLISAARLNDHLLPMGDNQQPVSLKNPLSDEYAILRPGLTPGLLEVAERNIHQGASALRLFEIGTIFHRVDDDAPTEVQHLGILPRRRRRPRPPGRMRGPAPLNSRISAELSSLSFQESRSRLNRSNRPPPSPSPPS